MFNLPSVAELYLASNNMDTVCNLAIEYNVAKNKARIQPNFSQEKFDQEFCKANRIKSIDELNRVSKENFNDFSSSIGLYEIANIKAALNTYAGSQKKIKKIINYFDNDLASILSADNASCDASKAKVAELKTDAGIALKKYSEKFKAKYDNITIESFKEKNVTEEEAMQNYAFFIALTFKNSSQSIKENKKAAESFARNAKYSLNDILLSEAKKVKTNRRIAERLQASKYTIPQVDDILGADYVDKKKWDKNLAKFFQKKYALLINSATTEGVTA